MLQYDSQYQIKSQDKKMSLIICDNVSLAYGKQSVLSELSFRVERGDYLCVVGENGSGKSTLVKTLLGLLSPVSGVITFGKGFTRKSIAYLPQQNAVQKDFPASVWEVVLSGRLSSKKIISFYNAHDREVAKEVMERLAISDLASCSFRELSGGQQQRVLLARALCSDSELLLVDEPTTGLDPVVTQDLYHLIEEVSSSGKTVIMVTHDIASAIKYATHILHLHHKPLFFGSKEDYINSDVGRGYIGNGSC